MNREDTLLVELQRLAGLPEMHGSLDAHLHELASSAARLLRARSCTFLWWTEEHSAPDGEAAMRPSEAEHASGDAVFKRVTVEAQATPLGELPVAGAAQGAPAGDMLRSPIRSSGRVIGVIHVCGPMDKPRFDGDDLRLLHIVTVFIGKSLQAAQLHGLLQSRFAQIALAQSVDDTVGQVLASVPHPTRIVKLLAKSFYREMTKAGFGANDIINAASQIISELSASLKRHAKRRDASLVEARSKQEEARPVPLPRPGRAAIASAR
ncbi:MAG TPA: GAF domain-containing protein [Burkholderiales bacterium]|nr:GAF domain-containing protein [Burkholderiales bacterium]